MPDSKSWLHCNNAAVQRADENKVNNTSSYIYFYESLEVIYVFVKGVWISFLVFRCDNPTYNISPCAFCFVRGREYLSLS